MRRAGGGADGHVALDAGVGDEQTGGVAAVDGLGRHKPLIVPRCETLHERAVFGRVEQEVFAGGAGVGGLELLRHGDEPVVLGVIAQRDAVRVDFDDLVAQRFHLVPSGGRGQAVRVEERLVVVQHFGGLAHRQRVHLAIAELTAFLVVRGNKVVLLLLRQAEGFGRAVGAGDGRRAVNVSIQRLHRTREVVQGNMVRVAVSDVGLAADGDFLGNLVADIIVAANGGVADMDVRVELVKLFDVSIQHGGQVGAHRVVEGDVHLAAVVSSGIACGFSRTEASSAGHQHGQRHEKREELLHVSFLPFWSRETKNC